MRAALLLLSITAAGCGGSSGSRAAGPAPAPAQAPADPDAPELQILERFQTLSDYVEQSKAHCERLATSIDTWVAGNRDEVTALMERARAEPGLEGDHMERVERRLEVVFDRVLGAVDGCRGTASVERAFARFDRFVEGV
jgi:hypothetical protein